MLHSRKEVTQAVPHTDAGIRATTDWHCMTTALFLTWKIVDMHGLQLSIQTCGHCSTSPRPQTADCRHGTSHAISSMNWQPFNLPLPLDRSDARMPTSLLLQTESVALCNRAANTVMMSDFLSLLGLTASASSDQGPGAAEAKTRPSMLIRRALSRAILVPAWGQ